MNYSTGALPPCRALEELHIPGNRLLNIDAVFSLMPALDLLDVRENRIPEAAKIAPAASLPELIILRVRGNPLCDDDAYADAILGTFPHSSHRQCVCAYVRYCTSDYKCDPAVSDNQFNYIQISVYCFSLPFFQLWEHSKRSNL